VHAFAGHIACDAASNSEIVIPVFKDNKVIAVLDIDSPSLARFDEQDKIGLEALVKAFEETL
ncbi:GAF domain-containing protein, partial [Pseudoalteromonas phenolica]